MKLNNENIDELMFQLLEGEIQGEERAKLLDAINADKVYSRQWQAWQQTVLNPSREMLVMDTGKLLKKEKKAVVLWWKYCAAAVVVMAVGVGVYYTNKPKQEEMVGIGKPDNPKLQIIKVPTVEPVNPVKKANDSSVSLKQKVEMMAEKGGSTVKKNEIKVKVQEQPVEKDMPHIEVQKAPEKVLVNVPEPTIKAPVKEKEEPIILAGNKNEGSGVIMTVYSGSGTKKSPPAITQKIQEKRNLLSRIFSMPKLKIVNDSNTYTNKKIILENKEYKIIAGF